MLVVFHRQRTEEAATELHASERCTRTGFLAIIGGEGFEALLYLRESIVVRDSTQCTRTGFLAIIGGQGL
jgi:hypothetical protein